MMGYRRFTGFTTDDAATVEIATPSSAKPAKVAKVDVASSEAFESTPRRSESTRTRKNLAAEADSRPVLLADDMLKLAGQSRELATATVKALVAFPDASGARIGPLSLEIASSRGADTVGAVRSKKGWSAAAKLTISWFEAALDAGELVAEPFQLQPWVRIGDPPKWYATLKGDIAGGSRGPRAGVLIEELRGLRGIVETKNIPA